MLRRFTLADMTRLCGHGKHLTMTFRYHENTGEGPHWRSAGEESLRALPMTVALDRNTAQAFYEALASRDPVRLDPFLDDDVDWLIVGPIELFAFCGQYYGRESVLDAHRQLSLTEEARGSACEFLLVTATARPR
jgi:hypothetical protein